MLNKILYKLILTLSKTPLWLLYIFSDILYAINYLIGYRKTVITQNLKNSFPNKSDAEIRKIRQKFYHNFFDYIVETLKAFTVTELELKVRTQHLNRKVFQDCYDEGKDVIVLAGHVFNWEWLTILTTYLPQESHHPVYRKIQSSFWEEKLKTIRNRFGNNALEAKEVIRNILRTKENGHAAYMFIADQTPHFSEIHYGLQFLNQLTPAFIGYDRLATKRDLAFVYCEMKKVKRGYYQANYHRIFPDGEKFEQYEVVKKFHKLLEETINKRPDNWLWSHRRWKYQDTLKS